MDVPLILNKVCSSKTKCIIKIDGSDELHDSCFLSADLSPENNYIEIRNLIPLSGNNILSKKKILQCEFIVDDLSLAFYTEYIESKKESSYLTHLISVPKRFLLNQKRRFMRVSPSPKMPASCVISYMDKKANELKRVVDIKVLDVSIGGVLIGIDALGYSWLVEQNIPKVELKVSTSDKNMTMTGIIRRISKIASFKGESLGIEFISNSLENESILSDYIAERQKEIDRSKKTPSPGIQERGKVVKFF